jgi:adenine/guanine phosphoribosyltransferase-like PRPP-binding protein
MPRVITKSEQRAMARSLCTHLAPFGPRGVVYMHRGGAVPGLTVAAHMGIPAWKLDLRYPVSRALDLAPPLLRAMLWPAKEALYRIGSPTWRAPVYLPPVGTRVALVDDSAGSGKTIAAALGALHSFGIGRESVMVAVLRCGKRARKLVDCWITDERVVFVR